MCSNLDVSERRQEDVVTTWERHGQTVVAALILLLLSWVGLNVNDNSKTIPVLNTKMSSLEKQIASLQTILSANAATSYRGVDARRDLDAVNKNVERVHVKIEGFGREQASRGPRIKNAEDDIRELFKLIREMDHKPKKSKR